MKLLPPPTMLKLDFSFALLGGLLYFLLFDFLQQSLGIPYRIVLVQLLANVGYGLFGVLIFIGGQKRMPLFRVLIAMNFAYAILCLPLGIYLLSIEASLGSALLFVEGGLIFLLAVIERRSIKSTNESPISS